jgi:hypothetical protein
VTELSVPDAPRSVALGLRWELVLLVGWVASFLLILVKVGDVYSGLPAHPLFLHVPVILIPVLAVGALAAAIRPRLLERYGLALGVLALAALVGTHLTVGAGEALRRARFSGGGAFGGFGGGGESQLIARHASAAYTLRILMIVFTLVLLLAVARAALGRLGSVPRGLSGLASSSALSAVLRVALATLAVASAFFVFHTGDLGAKAVWDQRGRPTGSFGDGGGGTGFGGGTPPPAATTP